MSVLNILLISSIFLAALLSFVLGIFSLIKNSRSKVVKLWFLTSTAVGFWSAALWLVLIANNRAEGILFSQLLHAVAVFIPIFFCHFVLTFLHKDGQKKLFLTIGYVLAVIFAIFSFSELIIPDVSEKFGFSHWADAGSLYPLLLIYFWFYVLASIIFLYQGHKRADGINKKKIFYILLAAVIGFIAGGTSYLPQTVGIYAFGDFFVWLYPVLITYGIFVDEFKFKIKF